MTSSLKKIDKNSLELTVEVGQEELKIYLRETEDQIVRDIKLDGFRKGKAPRDLIRKQVGEQVILEKGLDLTVKKTLSMVIEREKLEVLSVSNLEVKENSPMKLIYSVLVHIFPQIEIGDLSGIKIGRKEITVDKEEIDQAVGLLRDSRAEITVKEEGARSGDKVEIDLEVTSEDGLPIENGVSKNHPLVIGDGKFMLGFEDQIIGMKASEGKTFSLIAPADYFNKGVAGKKLNFQIKVIGVWEIKKPPANDEFARGLGRFSNFKEFEESLRRGIREEKIIKERQRLRLEMLFKILEKSKIKLPLNMVNEKLDEMLESFDRDLHSKGMEMSIYLAHLGKTEDDLRKDWKPEAERQEPTSSILKKTAKDNSLNPSEEEISVASNNFIQSMLVRGQIDQEGLKDINLDKIKEAVTGDIVNEKVFNFLEKK